MFKNVVFLCLALLALGCGSDKNSAAVAPPPSNDDRGDDAVVELTAFEKRLAALEGVKVKDTKGDYQLTIVDEKKMARLMRSEKNFAVNGVIYNTGTLTSSDAHLKGKPFCSVESAASVYVSESELLGLTFTLGTSQEKRISGSGSPKALVALVNEFDGSIGCTKSEDTSSDFTWDTVQEALQGIVEIDLIP